MDAPTLRTTHLRKAHHYCDLYGLTREDRLSLSEMVLRRDITSWKNLTDAQLERMLDVLEGYGLITVLLEQRHP